MAHKTLIGGTAYEIGGGKVLVGGTGYSIDKGRTKVGGTGYDIPFITGTPIGSLAVGTAVYMEFDGVRTEFLIVNQGNPDSTVYDESCDGTWLLLKTTSLTRTRMDTTNNDYGDSSAHANLNGSSYLYKFSDAIRSIIKQVKIPYYGGGYPKSLHTGSNGLSAYIFLLSHAELGGTYCEDGATLAYFTSGANSRIAKNTYGTKVDWWLRSPDHNDVLCDDYCYVTSTGGFKYENETEQNYYRYALILPSEAVVDEEFNVIA